MRSRRQLSWYLWALTFCGFINYKLYKSKTASDINGPSILDIPIESVKTYIPKHIYQTWKTIAVPSMHHVNTWWENNEDHEYTLFTDNSALKFVNTYFVHRPEILQLYTNLSQRILAADMLRYLVIQELGGIYTDIDTSCTRPIAEWFPKFDEQEYNIVVGVEADEPTWTREEVKNANFVDNVQFIQWTVMAKPRHPILNSTIESILMKLAIDVELQNKTLSELRYDESQVLDTTGPWIYSRAIRRYIDMTLNRTVPNSEFSSLKKPKLFGDVLVLPVNYWAPESPHSNSGNVGTSMLRHWQSGSWKMEFQEERDRMDELKAQAEKIAEEAKLKNAEAWEEAERRAKEEASAKLTPEEQAIEQERIDKKKEEEEQKEELAKEEVERQKQLQIEKKEQLKREQEEKASESDSEQLEQNMQKTEQPDTNAEITLAVQKEAVTDDLGSTDEPVQSPGKDMGISK